MKKVLLFINMTTSPVADPDISSNGGFGGGAGSHPTSEAGGAGGYSGGGTGSNPEPGGGGGSLNSGTNQDNQSGVNEGHGKVIITYIGN